MENQAHSRGGRALDGPSRSHNSPADSGHAHPSRARLYVVIFFVLGVLTMIEFGAANLPSPFKLPALLGLASVKALLVAGIYMHLRFDQRVFSTLMLLGLGIGILMVLTFTIVLGINWTT